MLESERVFEFDGENEIFNISGNEINAALQNGTFSLSVWLQTAENTNKKHQHTVLCKSNSKGECILSYCINSMITMFVSKSF